MRKILLVITFFTIISIGKPNDKKLNQIQYYNYEQPTFFFSLDNNQILNLPSEEHRKLVLEESPGANSDCIEETFDKVEIELNYRKGQEEYISGLSPTNVVSVTVNIHAFRIQSNTLIDDEIYCDLELELNNNNEIYIPESLCITDVTDIVNDNFQYDNIMFVIASISVNSGAVGSNDILEARLLVDRSVRITNSPNANDWIQIIEPHGDSYTGSNLLTYPQVDFKWKLENTSCQDDEVPFYQIQLLRLFNNSLSTTNDPKEITAEVDWGKALNFEVAGTNYNTQFPNSKELIYTISITEGTGYYIWRIRPIGDYYKNYTNRFNSNVGGIADDRNWGEWRNPSLISNPSEPIELVQGSIVDILDASDLDGGFYFEQFDENINWKYERIFTEGELDSKILEKITYYDNLLNVRQNQKYLASDNSKIVSQTIYDYSGRPAISTLPVPFKKDAVGNLGYQTGFMLNGTSLYSSNDFDDGRLTSNNNIFDPSSVTNSDILTYYDGDNTGSATVVDEDRIPSSTINSSQSVSNKAIPYKRILYENNSFSETKETSGFGEPFSFGSSSTGDSRTTKVNRVSALPNELIKILGNETPRKGGFKKTITQDPNGVVTVEYHNSKGQLIATAVKNSDIQTLNQKELEYDNTSTDKETLNNEEVEYKFNNRKIIDDGYTETIKLNLTSTPTTQLAFFHEFKQNSIELGCYYIETPESNCISCYDYVCIDILDAKTLQRPSGFSKIEITDNYSIEGACPTEKIPENWTVNLPPGTYIITKTVITKKDANGYSPKDDITRKVKSSIVNDYYTEVAPIITILDDIIDINGISDLEDLYTALKASSNWSEVIGYGYYHYTGEGCCDLKIYIEDCSACTGDLIEYDGTEIDSVKFQKKLVEEINLYLLDNGVAASELPRKPDDEFEPESDPSNTVINSFNVYPFFFRDDYKNESDADYNNLYSKDYDGLFDEMIENMLDEGTRFQEEELCDCWNNSINLFKNTAIKFEDLDPSNTTGFEFDESFDLLDVFLTCVDRKYDDNDDEKDICYEGYTNHSIYSATPTPPDAPNEGYLSHAYKYFYYDPINNRNEDCEDNLDIWITDQFSIWTIYEHGLTGSYHNDADANGGVCEPLDIDNQATEKYNLIYTKLYGCLRNGMTEQEAKDTWTEELGVEFCGYESYEELLDAVQNRTNLNQDYIDEVVNCLNRNCDDKCESRFEEFIPRLIQLFNENGYSVQGQSYYQKDINTDPDFVDPNGSDVWDIVEQYRMEQDQNKGHTVDMEEIYCMATALVDQCKSYCDVSLEIDGNNEPTKLNIPENYKKVFQSDFELELSNDDQPHCSGFALVDPISSPREIDERWWQYIEDVMNRLLDELILYNPNIPADWDEYSYYNDLGTTGSIEYSGGKTKFYHYKGSCARPLMDFKFTFWSDAYTEMEYNNSGFNQDESDDLNDYNANLIKTILNLLSDEMCISKPVDQYCPGYELKGFSQTLDDNIIEIIKDGYYLFEGKLYDYLEQDDNIEKIYFEWVDENEFNLVFDFNFGTVEQTKFNLFNYTSGNKLDNNCTSNNLSISCDSSVCFKWKDSYEVPDDAKDIAERNIRQDCDYLIAEQLKFDLVSQIDACASNIASQLSLQYDNICQFPEKDDLTVSYIGPDYYHYTLYYYDRAGNLIKTVPPNGIDFNQNATRNTTMNHTFESTYEYDSRNFLVEEKIPDRTHESVFIYNTVDQLSFSYDARQYEMDNQQNKNFHFSYSQYDNQGRIVETGEAEVYTFHMTNVANANGFATDDIKSYLEYHADNKIRLENFLATSMNKKMFIKTVYDFNFENHLDLNHDPRFPPLGNNLRNRINYTIRDEDGSDLTKGDQVKTFYSYDLHGNVEWVMNDIAVPEYNIPEPFRFIGMTLYDYDLISGNVKKVYYNPHLNDSYLHKYSYDEDQRIKQVETSRYGRIWDRDSRYQYYKHGPLKRIELGDDNLQGIDYTYTINGWLKAINHSKIGDNISSNLDPAADGLITPNENFELDAFGMILSYFDNDYWNYNYDNLNEGKLITFEGGLDLFNGNIKNWSFAENDYTNLNSSSPPSYPVNSRAFEYKYDVLNRLVSSIHAEYSDIPYGNWSLSADKYNSDYKYDPNGNILELNRNAYDPMNNYSMDELDYEYSYARTGQPENNRLLKVNDPIGDYTGNDFETSIYTNDFEYDGSGNLIKDNSEGIESIEWTSDGKIKKIITDDAEKIFEFRYDALGSRVTKRHRVWDGINGEYGHKFYDNTDTYYMREANANVMAVYENEEEPKTLEYVCFDISLYCPNLNDYVKRTICSDDFDVTNGVNDSIYTINSTTTPILDCDGNPVDISKIDVDIWHNRFEIEYNQPQPPPPTPTSYYGLVVNGPTEGPQQICFYIRIMCPDGITYEDRWVCSDNFEDDGFGGYEVNPPFTPPILDCNDQVIDIAQIMLDNNSNAMIHYNAETLTPPIFINNVLNFTLRFNGNTGINLSEWHIWGSGSEDRIGIRRPEREELHYFDDYINYPYPTKDFSRYIRYKDYELKDHLGNVRATLTDLKRKDPNSNKYIADLSSANTYYPFGMLMPERNWSSEWYRYGFQGQEKDDEIKGEGNSLDLGERFYDPRIGRINYKIDPMSKSFPWNSPYSYAENDVIRSIDLDGLEKVVIIGGADLFGDGISSTTLKTAEEIEEYSEENNLGYEVKTFNIAPWNPSFGTAFEWIKDNYNEGESIIIYGYSLGGVGANQLSKMLKTEGITVDLFVAVDAAFGIFTVPLEIPSNVEEVKNYFQENRSIILSRGYEAIPMEGNENTIIDNIDYTGKTSGKGLDAHSTMDEDTQKKAVGNIQSEMKKSVEPEQKK